MGCGAGQEEVRVLLVVGPLEEVVLLDGHVEDVELVVRHREELVMFAHFEDVLVDFEDVVHFDGVNVWVEQVVEGYVNVVAISVVHAWADGAEEDVRVGDLTVVVLVV